MLFTKAAKLERRFRSGDYRPFDNTKISHIFSCSFVILSHLNLTQYSLAIFKTDTGEESINTLHIAMLSTDSASLGLLVGCRL
jgi:hypothetical protein